MKKIVFISLLMLLAVATSCSKNNVNEEEEICIANFPTVRVAHQGLLLPGLPDIDSPIRDWPPPLQYIVDSEGGGIILVADGWYWSDLLVFDDWPIVNFVYKTIYGFGNDQVIIDNSNSNRWFEVRLVTSQKVVVKINPNIYQSERGIAVGMWWWEKGPFAVAKITQSAE